MRIPIRYQFMLPLLGVAVTSLVAIAFINAHRATQQTRERIEKQLRGVVSVLTESSYPLANSVLRQMGGLAHAEFVLTDASGNMQAASSEIELQGRTPDILTSKNPEDVVLGPALMVDSKPYLHSSIWVQRRNQNSEPTVLHILFPQEDYDSAWRAAFLPPVIIGLVTVAAVALVVHLVAGRVSRILAHLGEEVQRFSQGDYAAVELSGWNDETLDLASSINRTATQLAEYEAELRRSERLQTVAMIGAGLAHEMRNAATGCRMALDLHAEDCPQRREDDSLDVARRQLSLMENRLQQLLHLGRPQTGSSCKSTDLATLVSEAVALVQPAATHAGIQLSWEAPQDGFQVQADAELLGQAIMNLLLNALDAAKKGQAQADRSGLVHVEVSRLAEVSELVVTDSGGGIDMHVEGEVFEPFVTSKPEGVGLGLAVANRVVEACGGKIGWDQADGRTNFRIRLPLATAGVSHV